MTPPRLLPPALKPFLSSSLLHFHPRLPPLHPSCLQDPLPLSGRLCVPFSSGRLLHSFTSSLASQASVSLFPLVIPLLPCITLIFALHPASLHHPALLIFLFFPTSPICSPPHFSPLLSLLPPFSLQRFLLPLLLSDLNSSSHYFSPIASMSLPFHFLFPCSFPISPFIVSSSPLLADSSLRLLLTSCFPFLSSCAPLTFQAAGVLLNTVMLGGGQTLVGC